MDRSRHKTTKNLEGFHVDRFINNRFFKYLNELKDQIFQVEMSKTRIQHKEPIIVWFFILLYAKVTMWQLKNIFLSSFCDTNKYEMIEMDTESLLGT